MIIVAISAIASSVIPNYSFSFHLRIYRFVFILLGYIAGFLGISLGLFIYICLLTSVQSFGINLSTPYAPYISSKNNNFFLPPIWKREYRPKYLNPKNIKKQNHISMKWREK